MSLNVEIARDPARACAAMLVGVAAGGGDIVLAGGSTPRAAYEELVDAVRAVDADLSATTMWIGDERCVPPEDERSNYGMIKQSLLDPLAAMGQKPVVHRMKGELGFSEGAADYESRLRSAGPPQFDVVLLGIGPDGHTASLFPDQESLNERERLVVGVKDAGLEPYVSRVSFTLSAIALGKHVVFLASGDSKAEAVAAAFGNDAEPDPHVPSSMVAAVAKEVTVLLDAAAASRL